MKEKAEAAMRGIYRKDSSHIRNRSQYASVFCATTAIIFSVATFSTALAATTFQGDLKSVSIADAIGTNNPPTAVFTYTVAGNKISFDGSKSVDSDGNITEYKWNFGDGTTASGSTTSHDYSNLSNIRVSLTVKDNSGSVSIVQHPIIIATPTTPVNIAVNFQPTGVPIPSGFSVDSGDAYSDQKGYGWLSLPNSFGPRDRNNALSPDQAYDTFNHVLPTAVWEHKVENGIYTVKVVMGDPSYPDETSAVQVEQQVFIPPTTLNASLRWIEKQATVEVKDQKLTLTFTGSSIAKLSWIRISR